MTPRVLSVSAHTGAGLDQVWQAVEAHQAALGPAGIAARRQAQTLAWFDELLRLAAWERLRRGLDGQALEQTRRQVETGRLTPVQGVQLLLGPVLEIP